MKHVFIVGLLGVGLIGCGGASTERSAARKAGVRQTSAPAALMSETVAAADRSMPLEAPTLDRKIIYRAEIELVVTNFAAVESAAPRLISDHGGYLADMRLARNTGDNRTGTWVARVPVDRFDAFLEAASTLGVPVRRHQTGEDVTVEFVDLEARLAAKQKFEARLLKLLDDRTDGVKDLIEVEKELARVRGEIERMEGRRRYLVNQTTFTTITLTAREQRNYTPPEAPGLGGRIASAWGGSLGAMGDAASAMVVGAAGATPWLLALGLVAGPAWWWRKSRLPAVDDESDSVLAEE